MSEPLVPTIEVGTGNQVKVIEPVLLVGIDESGNIVPLKCDELGNLQTSY
jgi:hypothetical protein